MSPQAIAVTVYHRIGDREAFLRWSRCLFEAAARCAGFRDSSGDGGDSPGLDWATAVTFDSEEALHRWLDSAERRALLSTATSSGFPRCCPDIVIVDRSAPPTGVGLFRHAVSPERTADFLATQQQLVRLSAAFSGFEGGAVLESDGVAGQWISILRFRTDHQLQSWLNSEQRCSALPELRSQLTEDFAVITHSTPFGSILRVQDGTTTVTPNWKTAMLVLMVLYPTVMTLSRFLGPVLTDLGSPEWLGMWLSQIVSVGLMTWFLMPVVTGWFRRWLDPVEGAGLGVSVRGASVVAVVYAATLALFASVTWLQFWDYPG